MNFETLKGEIFFIFSVKFGETIISNALIKSNCS